MFLFNDARSLFRLGSSSNLVLLASEIVNNRFEEMVIRGNGEVIVDCTHFINNSLMVTEQWD